MRSCLIIWYSSMTLFCYYHACPYVLLSMLTDLIYLFFLSIFFAWSDNHIFCNCRGMLMYVCTIMVSWRRHLTWGIMFRASTLCAYSKFTLANYLWHIVCFKLPISRSAHFCSFPLHHPLYYLTSNLDWQVPFPNKRPAYPSSFSIDWISVCESTFMISSLIMHCIIISAVSFSKSHCTMFCTNVSVSGVTTLM